LKTSTSNWTPPRCARVALVSLFFLVGVVF
jgi:hypothetical protein